MFIYVVIVQKYKTKDIQKIIQTFILQIAITCSLVSLRPPDSMIETVAEARPRGI